MQTEQTCIDQLDQIIPEAYCHVLSYCIYNKVHKIVCNVYHQLVMSLFDAIYMKTLNQINKTATSKDLGNNWSG